MSTAEILIASAIKTVGKRVFLKAVNKMFAQGEKVVRAKGRNHASVPEEVMCVARKGIVRELRRENMSYMKPCAVDAKKLVQTLTYALFIRIW